MSARHAKPESSSPVTATLMGPVARPSTASGLTLRRFINRLYGAAGGISAPAYSATSAVTISPPYTKHSNWEVPQASSRLRPPRRNRPKSIEKRAHRLDRPLRIPGERRSACRYPHLVGWRFDAVAPRRTRTRREFGGGDGMMYIGDKGKMLNHRIIPKPK